MRTGIAYWNVCMETKSNSEFDWCKLIAFDNAIQPVVHKVTPRCKSMSILTDENAMYMRTCV